MNPFLQQMINHKINNLNRTQLTSLANDYNVALTQEQATQILRILKAQQIDIFNNHQRMQLLQQLERVVGRNTAQQVNQIFLSFTQIE